VLRQLDTSLDADRRQIRAYRAMTPSERLRLADAMSDEVLRLALAGLTRRRPDLSVGALAAEFEQQLRTIDATSTGRTDTKR
jgi:hypothetical protein